MTSNSQLKRKNIDLKFENDNLRDLRWSLMADNRRLERERDEARAGEREECASADKLFEERNEARWWACHLYDALTDIRDMAFDYDGYREAPNLMELIDEIREIAGRAQVGK